MSFATQNAPGSQPNRAGLEGAILRRHILYVFFCECDYLRFPLQLRARQCIARWRWNSTCLRSFLASTRNYAHGRLSTQPEPLLESPSRGCHDKRAEEFSKKSISVPGNRQYFAKALRRRFRKDNGDNMLWKAMQTHEQYESITKQLKGSHGSIPAG